jgi:hypothetical protein
MQRLQRARCHVLQGQHFAIGAGAERARPHALLIPVQAAHQNGMMPPAVTE